MQPLVLDLSSACWNWRGKESSHEWKKYQSIASRKLGSSEELWKSDCKKREDRVLEDVKGHTYYFLVHCAWYLHPVYNDLLCNLWKITFLCCNIGFLRQFQVVLLISFLIGKQTHTDHHLIGILQYFLWSLPLILDF